MRVLFSTEPASGIFNHLSVVSELARRGHEVTIAVHGRRDDDGRLDAIAQEVPNVQLEAAPSLPADRWIALESDVRSSLDFLTFLDSRFNDTYRARSRRRAPRMMRALVPLFRPRPLRALARAALQLVERVIPVDRELEAYLGGLRPDVALFTPYVGMRTSQVHFLRAAQARQIRTAICVKSWDNLSSKSALRPVPDRVFVWNEYQRIEAESLHGVPAGRIRVTGAQCFDQWRRLAPRPRAEFAEIVGTDPAMPIVLYTCCAPWTKQSEAPFIRRWLEAVRRADDPFTRTAAVIVRPHPKRWDDVRPEDLESLGPVAVWPRGGRAPVDPPGQQDYFDSIFHSAAVVGLNTTAMLEASLLGRPVLTVLDPEYRALQHGTLHFRYLLEVGGGLLSVSETLDEHVAQLAAAIRSGDEDGRSARFARAFLLPPGVAASATDTFATAVEELASLPRPGAPTQSLLLKPIRFAVDLLARRAARGFARRLA
jgi:hypothetical protein